MSGSKSSRVAILKGTEAYLSNVVKKNRLMNPKITIKRPVREVDLPASEFADLIFRHSATAMECLSEVETSKAPMLRHAVECFKGKGITCTVNPKLEAVWNDACCRINIAYSKRKETKTIRLVKSCIFTIQGMVNEFKVDLKLNGSDT